MERLQRLLEEYQRKKWFPDRYPDPYGELIDILSVERLLELAASKDRRAVNTAYFLSRAVAPIQFPELWRDRIRAADSILEGSRVRPDSVFYYIRSLPENASRELWLEFREWCARWRNPLENWVRSLRELASQLEPLRKQFTAILKVDPEARRQSLAEQMKTTRDIFAFQTRELGPPEQLPDLIRSFRWKRWDSVADWNDLRALAKSIAENWGIKTPPKLKKENSTESMQSLFPIVPPTRVQVRYGKAAGAADVARFLQEFGAGCFYAGMNPELEVQDRICGDPALPAFWGGLFTLPLSTAAGLNRLVGPQAESLAGNFRLLQQFSYRYDCMLAIYNHRVPEDLKESQDHYVDCFESTFSWKAPHFLYLYDLERSSEALFRAIALEAAAVASDQLALRYGRIWFTDAKFQKRIREYWREGFRLTLQETLADLRIEIPAAYPFL